MRIIILTIFAICMAGTVKAQTEFSFSCYNEEIAAIPDAPYDDDNDQSDDYDRVAYINSTVTPNGFSVYANEERIVVHEGIYPSGTQRWYSQVEVNYISYVEFNVIYKIMRKALINLEYGYAPLYGN